MELLLAPCYGHSLAELSLYLDHDEQPYVKTLIEMGYDESDCRASRAETVEIHSPFMARTYDTKEEYDEAMADFLNGL